MRGDMWESDNPDKHRRLGELHRHCRLLVRRTDRGLGRQQSHFICLHRAADDGRVLRLSVHLPLQVWGNKRGERQAVKRTGTGHMQTQYEMTPSGSHPSALLVRFSGHERIALIWLPKSEWRVV